MSGSTRHRGYGMAGAARALLGLGLGLALSTALANPEGPQVVSGSATFTRPNANVLDVHNSHNAIINWQSFDIGAGQTTNFHQPSRASAVLNRVLSASPSQIYGRLNSNGRVFVINQHGLMIGAGAQINTAGFFGSTLDITNEDFLNGNLKFEGGGFGGIDNQGYIHAGPGGNVVLIAPDIENGGVIEVDDGNVILAAGESIRITSLNDAAIEFDVQAPDNGIVNLGSIIANQGAARLFAGNLRHSGDINATGIVQNADGSISLVAQQDIFVEAGATLAANGDDGGRITIRSHHGTTLVAGDVSARGTAGIGGDIRILGERVGIVDAARVDASGSTAGGQVLVGGDYKGGNPDVQNARATYVGPATSLHADATEAGDGGRVIVWSDEATRSYGAISARGGPHGGDGGFIETSGGSLDLGDAVPDVSAPAGRGGEWLIDPNNIRIQLVGPDTNVTTPGPIFDTLADSAILTTGTINTALDGGAVTISTGTAGANSEVGNIDILDDITYNNTAANTLTFNAHNDINLLANISSIGGGPLDVVFNADSDSSGAGQIYLNGGADLFGGSFDFAGGFDATFLGGTYRNLIWTSTKNMPVTLAASSNMTFDNVTLDFDLNALNGSKISFANNLTINSTRTLTLASDGAITALESASATASVNGPGDLVLGGTAANNQILAGSNSTLTLGTGLTVSGQGSINALNASSSLVNDATIVTDGSGIIIDALAWSNLNGTLIAGNGATLTLRQAALVNDGKLQVDSGATISTENQDLTNTGVAEGTGQINVGSATFINDGTVGPGVGVDSPGVLNIVGNYSQTTGGILNIELDGTSPGTGAGFHDHLAISGNAALDGVMNVATVSGYVPNAFDSFQVVTFNSRTGGFANVNQPLGFDPIAVSLNSIDLFFNPGGVYFWTGGGITSSWDDVGNWSTLGVPSGANDVNIGAFSVTVDNGGAAATLSLAAGGSLDITNGAMTLGALLLGGSLTIGPAGSLSLAQSAAPFEIDVAAGGLLTNNGGTLANGGESRFAGGFVQNGPTATTTLSAGASFSGPFGLNGGTLQLDQGGTMSNANNSWTAGTIQGLAGQTLTLAGTPGSAKLTLSGAAPKTLSGLTLDTGSNVLEIFGAGDFDLILNAVLQNVAGGGVHHFGNGDITTDGTGQITNLGAFINFAGDSEVAIDFDNRGTGQIVNLGGIQRFTRELIQSGALDVAGGIVLVADPTGGTDTGNYGVAASGALTFTTDRVLNGALDTAGLIVVDNGAALTLPASLTFGGALELRNNSTLNLVSLPASTLTMNNVLLGGLGTINGNVVNDSGVLFVGSNGAIGNLSITGTYTQNPNAFVVVEALNNGFTTISDQLIVGGPATLNGGSLVIGFTTTSLGLVTSNFTPFDFQGGVVGNFGSVIDAGGNILFLQRIGNQIIVLGAPPQTPGELLSALLKFIKAVRELAELIASNQAEAEALMLALRERLEGDGSSALICR